MSGDITVSVSLQMTMTIEKEQDLVQTQKKAIYSDSCAVRKPPVKREENRGKKRKKRNG